AEGDRGGAVARWGAAGGGEGGGDGEQRRGTGHQPQLGQRRDREHVVAVGAQYPLAKRDREGGGGQPGGEGGRADYDGLGRQHPAAARAGGQGGTDQAPPVFGGDEQRRHHDHRDQPGERAEEGAVDPAATIHDRGDVAGPGDRERAAGLL